MKVIFRADDVGYTHAHNLGTFKTIEEGVTSACDLMLDCPGTEEACEYLKNHPWISVGWHVHFWGRPVLDTKEVPSMVNEEGRFKWRKDKSLMNEIDFDEAVKECRAQIERCIRLLGRVPDTGQGDEHTVLGRAIQQVCDEYGIVGHFTQGKGYGNRELYCQEKYKPLNIYEYVSRNSAFSKTLNVVDFPYYHPELAIINMPIEEDRIWLRSQHPGFLDDYVLRESSCTIPRVQDVYAYTCDEVKNWIIENNIEIVNTRDALHGTNDYQNYLKATKSPLAVKR